MMRRNNKKLHLVGNDGLMENDESALSICLTLENGRGIVSFEGRDVQKAFDAVLKDNGYRMSNGIASIYGAHVEVSLVSIYLSEAGFEPSLSKNPLNALG